MAELIRTNGTDKDFHSLVEHLDRYLSGINGEQDAFFSSHNKLHDIHHVVLFYDDDKPVACGAFKKYDEESAEIKRMFVLPEYRGKGIASIVLAELENWAAEEGFQFTVLETAKTMEPAVNLYKKLGYTFIPNYGQYIGVDLSVCMRKPVTH